MNNFFSGFNEKWKQFVSKIMPNSGSSGTIESYDDEPKKNLDTSPTYWDSGKKNFWQDGKSFIPSKKNPYANNKQLAKDDMKELSKSIFSKAIKIVIAFVILLLALVCAVSIYKLGYGMINDSKVSTIGGYSDYIVQNDLLSPTINQNDMVILKKVGAYQADDIILYTYAEGTAYRLGRVVDSYAGKCIVSDSASINEPVEVYVEDVVGKMVKHYKKFYTIYNTVTSPFFVVCVIGIVAVYFYLISKGRIKDEN